MKKILSMALVLCLFVSLLPVSAGAVGGTCGEDLLWEMDSEGVLTVSGTGDMTDYESEEDTPWYDIAGEITRVVLEPGVTGIGNYAFTYCHSLKQIDLPEGLTRIGDCALEGCAFQALSLPASLERIGTKALAKTNYWLKSITVASGNTAFRSVNNSLFDYGMTRLIIYMAQAEETVYEIPDTVRTIDPFAFFEASRLERISVPDGVAAIEENTFMWCAGMTEIRLPASLKRIGSCAFTGCDNLTDIQYGGSLADWYKIRRGEENQVLRRAAIHCTDGESVSSSTVAMGPVVGEGRCGPDVYWQKDASGTLRIYGSGSTYDFQLTGTYTVGDEDFFPTWIFQEPAAECVIIESGVTRIGRGTFTDVPDIIKRLTHVYLCDISDIYYTGTAAQWAGFVENSSDSYNALIENAAVYTDATVLMAGEEDTSRAEISALHVEGDTVACTVSVAEAANAWFALYDEEGRFLGAEHCALTAEAENDLHFQCGNANAENFKIFVLTDGMAPLCSGCEGSFSND